MDTSDAKSAAKAVEQLKERIATVFVGKQHAVHHLLIGFLSGLHVLIEDIPGLGKTTLAMTLAKAAGLDFGRIQFTPDILPGDIVGMTVWSAEKREFVYKEGAVMHQFVLADEINRASARTQSSLLEAMQEQTVSVDGRTISLPEPFFVVATQNPTSFTGTFLLPESQTDRFGVSLSIGYPAAGEEVTILERFKVNNPLEEVEPVTTPEEIINIRNMARLVRTDRSIDDYLVAIAENTRKSARIRLGMSPRATQHLLLAAQTQALFSGRTYVIPEDVMSTANAVLAHRIILSAEAKVNNLTAASVIEDILSKTPAPSGTQ